jgi:hypothetical protein
VRRFDGGVGCLNIKIVDCGKHFGGSR